MTELRLTSTPPNWDEVRLRHVVDLNPVKSEVAHLPPDTEVSFVPMEAVGALGGMRVDDTRLLEDVYSGYTYFRDGDVVVAKITPCFENGKGALVAGLHGGLGFGTTEFHVLRPTDRIDGRFLSYITWSHPFREIGASQMTGAAGQKRIPEDFIADLRVPLPSTERQRAIANFLDEKTAIIDDLIEKKERLIELLEEKRAALINRAVTKGLDPDVPMKDSGIPWIGEIPEHWAVQRLRFLLRDGPTNGVSPSISSSPSEVVTFSISALRDGQVQVESHEKFADATLEEVDQYLIRVGDILLVRGNGNRDLVARAGLVTGPLPDGCIYPDILMRLRPKDGAMRPHFLVKQLNSHAIHDQVHRFARTTTGTWKVNNEDIGNFKVLVSPLGEQDEILRALSVELDRIDLLIASLLDQRTKISEYRQSLITAAVTGQLDIDAADGEAA